MKLKLRTLDDAEARDLRERAEARQAVQSRKTSWQVAGHSLHQEFSRIVPKEQPVFHLRAQGPKAIALNRELAGLEFFRSCAWYHPATETVALERYTGENVRAVALLDLASAQIVDLVAGQRLIWRSLVSGTMVVHSDAGFSALHGDGRVQSLLPGHAHGSMIEDMLVAFNIGEPRIEMALVDPVLMRCEDSLGADALGTALGVELGRDVSIRFLHSSEEELCFELLLWNAGLSTSIRKFAVGIACIALGTIDD